MRAQKFRTYPVKHLSLALLLSHSVHADDSNPVTFEGHLTTTFQAAADGAVANEAVGRLDLLTHANLGPGDLTVNVQGSTTPRQRGVSTWLPEVNNNAGIALDEYGHGRLQVSEFFYALAWDERSLSMGLLDPHRWLDTSRVANSEITQFMAGPLVNNPVIDFPDYTLGIIFSDEPKTTGLGFNLLLSSSHGLSDNPQRSYDQLIRVRDDGKGVFAAAEGVWKGGDLIGRLGVWSNTAEHLRLNGAANTRHNMGLYGVMDGPVGAGAWSLRAGVADAAVAPGAWFLGAAVEQPAGPATVGLGVTYTGAAGDLVPGTGDTTLAEIYARFDLHPHVQITPLIQYVHNPGFDHSGTVLDSTQWIAGLRLSVPF